MLGRARTLCLVAVACAVSGCTPTIATLSPVKFDTTAPASHLGPSKFFGDGVANMDHQVNLVSMIVSELQRDDTPWRFLDGKPAVPTTTASALGRYDVYIGGDEGEALDRLVAAVGVSPRKDDIRNDVVNQLMAASKGNCVGYLKSLRGQQVTSRLAFDALAGGFATAGSIVSSASMAKLLAGLSAYSTAENASVDRNVFALQAEETIADAILKLRAEDEDKLVQKMTLSYDAWPLGRALGDVFDYHGDCSLMRGLTQVSGALEQREQSINIVRNAAAQAQTNPQTATAMLQLLSSMQTPQATSVLPVLSQASAWSKDLQAAVAAQVTCIEAVKTILLQDPTKTLTATLATPPSSCAPDPQLAWLKLPSGQSSLNIQQLPTPLAAGATGTAVTTYDTDVSIAFAGFEQSYQLQANAQIAPRAATRAAMAQALQAWQGNADVVSFLQGFAQVSPPKAGEAGTFSPALKAADMANLDPVIAYAIATAYTAAQDPTKLFATAVAAQALSQAQQRYKAMTLTVVATAS